MEIKTDGIVIGEAYTGEADRIITVLTRDAGMVRAFAKGSRAIKSPSSAATRLLTYSSFIFYKSEKGNYNVKSAAVKEVFYSLRNDVVKLSLAEYFAQLVYEFSPSEEESEQVLRLILNAIYFLMEDKRDHRFLKAAVELRLISLAGYMPSVSLCTRCSVSSDEKQLYFCPSLGESFCFEHRPAAKAVAITPAVIRSMEHIFSSSIEKLFALKVSGTTLELLSDLSEEYILKNTEKKFEKPIEIPAQMD